MTPAINQLNKAKVLYTLHEYDHDTSVDSYGIEASEKLNVPENRVFKTLVVRLSNDTFAVGILSVSSQLNMKLMAKALGVKKALMANPRDVERMTGYVLGGVSPLGQKKSLPTVIDASAEQQGSIYISAGRRGLEIELAPNDLKRLTQASFSEISVRCD